MNPIEKFENAAFKAYRKNAGANEKALSLTSISNAISSYLDRVDLNSMKELDPWQHAKATRAVEYLKLLQKDVNELATLCRREAFSPQAKSKAKPAARKLSPAGS